MCGFQQATMPAETRFCSERSKVNVMRLEMHGICASPIMWTSSEDGALGTIYIYIQQAQFLTIRCRNGHSNI